MHIVHIKRKNPFHPAIHLTLTDPRFLFQKKKKKKTHPPFWPHQCSHTNLWQWISRLICPSVPRCKTIFDTILDYRVIIILPDRVYNTEPNKSACQRNLCPPKWSITKYMFCCQTDMAVNSSVLSKTEKPTAAGKCPKECSADQGQAAAAGCFLVWYFGCFPFHPFFFGCSSAGDGSSAASASSAVNGE